MLQLTYWLTYWYELTFIFFPRNSNVLLLTLLTCLRVEGTLSVCSWTASEHPSSDLPVALGLVATSRPGCLQLACDLVGIAALLCHPRSTCAVMAKTPLKKVHIQLRERPFALWILKIVLSEGKWPVRSISDIEWETFRHQKALLICVNTHVPIKIGAKIFWWHFRTPNLDLI